MKNIKSKLVKLFKSGYCTPKISKIAKKLSEPSTTIHYNIKKMEKEGWVKSYKAVFDYKKINLGFCTYVLINLTHEEYDDPEKTARKLAKNSKVESIDIVTGDWELILKVRTEDIDEFYNFVKTVLSKKGIANVKSLNSLKQIKTEFVEI